MFESVMEKRIMWGDLDALGIVFYPRYYEWFDGCAHQFFEAIDLSLDRLWKEDGIIFGLAETQCQYMKAGRYHQRLRIATQIESLHLKGLTLRHTITLWDSGKIMAVGTEKRICMDVSDTLSLKTAVIPDSVYRKLEGAFTE